VVVTPRNATTRKSAARVQAEKRAAAAQARLAAAQRRRRLIVVGSTMGAVVLLVAVLVIVKVATGAGGPKSGRHASAAASRVVTDVTSVPTSVMNTVGAGTASLMPKPLAGSTAMTADGKPRVLYAGAEYCPYCATERWAIVVALSRFGTFHNLGQTASSPSDVYPSTATLSFHGATYTSKYLSFTGVEMQSNQVVNGHYANLDTLSTADQALFQKYDTAPLTNQTGAIPFIDLAGKYGIAGAQYNPQVLQGKTHAQIAAALSNPASPIARGADGAANLITAALCQSTNNQPTAVCASPGVRTAKAALGRV
jgi:hypothetical protein